MVRWLPRSEIVPTLPALIDKQHAKVNKDCYSIGVTISNNSGDVLGKLVNVGGVVIEYSKE